MVTEAALKGAQHTKVSSPGDIRNDRGPAWVDKIKPSWKGEGHEKV